MSQNVLLGDVSVAFGELLQPFLASAALQSSIVFPIGKSTVEVVGLDKLCQCLTTLEAIGGAGVGELVVAECTHKHSHSVIIVLLSKAGLDLLSA